MSLDHDNISTELISELNENDVINGKGSYVQDQNAAYRRLVQSKKELYAASPTNKQKDDICRWIVETIRKKGGRFLEKRDNSIFWYETGNEKAIEKTKQAIRDANSASRKKERQLLPVFDITSTTLVSPTSTMQLFPISSIPEHAVTQMCISSSKMESFKSYHGSTGSSDLFSELSGQNNRHLSIATATTSSSSMSIGTFGSSSQSLSLHEESGQQQQQMDIDQMDIVTSAEHSPIRVLGARRLATLNILQTPFLTTASLPSCMSTETLESSGLISQDSIRTCQQEETDISSVEVSPRKTNNERISLRNKQFSVFFKKKTTKNT